jgi:hypothetical protein
MPLIRRATAHWLPCLLILVTCLFINSPAKLWAATQIVAQTGDDSPDGNGELDLFFAPIINVAGQVAFATQLTGTAGGTADSGAMFRRDTNGVLTKIARSGEAFEGKTLHQYFYIPYPSYLSSNGTVTSLIFFTNGAGSAYLDGSGGALARVAPTGMPSPSGQSNALVGVNNVVVNDSGVAVYRGIFTGAQNEAGLYQRTTDGTHMVRLLSQTAAPRGGTITSTGTPTINESNQIGTFLTINNTVRSAALINGTTVHELVRQGDLLPDGVTTVSQFPNTQSFGFINSAGQVAFAANITRPGYGGQGIILADMAAASCVATGVLPGSTSAANNLQVFGISDTGRAAFTAEFGGGLDPASGMYLAGTSGAMLVAFEDAATPVPGKYIRGFVSDGSTVNNAGQVAFIADLSDTINGASSGNGIFFYDQTSGLQQVARTGDSLGGSTIASVSFYGTMPSTIAVSPETNATGLNNLGQVAFAYSLANGTDGVAIWTPPAGVPGDYNNNGIVDAADYVLWRKGGPLANEVDATGTVNAADHAAWRSRFGNSSGNGASIIPSAAVPEPSTLVLIILAAASACSWRHQAVCTIKTR